MKDYLDHTVNELLTEYKDGSIDEPLNRDEVDDFVEIIKAKVNLQEGNITEKDYNKILG